MKTQRRRISSSRSRAHPVSNLDWRKLWLPALLIVLFALVIVGAGLLLRSFFRAHYSRHVLPPIRTPPEDLKSLPMPQGYLDRG